MLSGGGQTRTWDEFNRIASDMTVAGTDTYVYDANGERLIRRNATQATLYFEDEEITATVTTLTGCRYYAAADGAARCLRLGATDIWLTFVNAHKSVMATARASTNEIRQRLYDPWGVPRSISGVAAPVGDYGFLYQQTDPTTGLVGTNDGNPYDPNVHQVVAGGGSFVASHGPGLIMTPSTPTRGSLRPAIRRNDRLTWRSDWWNCSLADWIYVQWQPLEYVRAVIAKDAEYTRLPSGRLILGRKFDGCSFVLGDRPGGWDFRAACGGHDLAYQLLRKNFYHGDRDAG